MVVTLRKRKAGKVVKTKPRTTKTATQKTKKKTKTKEEPTEIYEVKILHDKKRVTRRGRSVTLYLVEWKDYPNEEDWTWEPKANLPIPGADELIEDLEKRLKSQAKEKAEEKKEKRKKSTGGVKKPRKMAKKAAALRVRKSSRKKSESSGDKSKEEEKKPRTVKRKK